MPQSLRKKYTDGFQYFMHILMFGCKMFIRKERGNAPNGQSFKILFQESVRVFALTAAMFQTGFSR